MTPHRTVGSGPRTVLLLHGWFGSAQGWGTFPDLLDRERFTWVYVDNRGYGARRDEPGQHSLAEVASDVLALADEIGAGTFSLVGHSMGGAGVLRVLAEAPDRVERIVGICPVGATPTPLDDAARALFYGAADSRDLRYGIIDLTTGNRLTPTFVDAVVDHSLESSTRDAFAASLDAWANADFLEAVAGREVPVLVLAGEHDPAVGLETVTQTWRPHFRDCTVEVVPSAGHYPMLETPAALAARVESFLAG